MNIPKNKTRTLQYLLLVAVLIISVIPSASALLPTKDYDATTNTVSVKDWLGLGADIANITLLTPQINYVMPGKDRLVAEIKVNNYNDYNNVFGNIELINNKDGKAISRPITYKYKIITGQKEVTDYERVCDKKVEINGSVTNTCTNKIIGTHKEDVYGWSAYDKSSPMSKGDITIGIFADVYSGDNVEWVQNAYGVKLDEWATWTDSLTVGMVSYYDFEDANFAVALQDDYGTNDLIDSAGGSIANFSGIRGNSVRINDTPLIGNRLNFTSSLFKDGNSTISIWFNKSIGQISGYSVNELFGSGASAINPDCLGVSFLSSGGTPKHISIQSGPFIWSQNNNSIDEFDFNVWHNVVMVTAENSTKVYVDGALEIDHTNGAFATANDGGWVGMNLTAQWFLFDGTNNDNGMRPASNMSIDEVGVWKRTLTASEVTDLYNGGTGIFYRLAGRVYENSQTYNSTTLEGRTESFAINITYNSTYYNPALITASLNYNGSVYAGTKTGTGDDIVFSKSLVIPSSAIGLQYFNWTINMNATSNFTSDTYTQTVYPLLLTICNSTGIPFVNITFKDETTGAYINATLDSSSWSYNYPGLSAMSYIYANTTHNPRYAFCVYPAWASPILSTETIHYSGTQGATYPQRIITFNDTLTNSTLTTKVLYLLASTSGSWSSFQVITVGNQVIAGAYIKVERDIGGVTTTITDGFTDDSGQISFFLNPNYDHVFTVVASGYSTLEKTLKPSLSAYTFTMGGSTTPFLYTNNMEGITYSKWPASGRIWNTGVYNFTFNINSTLGNKIYNCTMIIHYQNGSVFGQTTGCNASAPNAGSGGIISTSLNVTGISTANLYGAYYVVLLNNSNIMIEGDAHWNLIVPPNSNSFGRSLRGFINASIYLPEWGSVCGDGYHIAGSLGNVTEETLWCYSDTTWERYWNQSTDFSRITFFFIALVICLAALNFYFQYDTAYPGSFLYLITGLVFIFTAVNGIAGPGFFYMPGVFFVGATGFFAGVASVMDNWILCVNFIMLSLLYFFTTQRRYQT